ncbi:hypothetical protein [Bradyrhizobium canariense]|uniref:hypothetical protein n=1 Tax=Bradyrhizobium canariense TaxID=255045 RepID=UPI0018E9E69D|nr:hypothetical protein [Bradyrhizobium canariense]
MFRTLVDQMTLVAGVEELAIVLRVDLAAILRFAANKKKPDILSEAGVLGALLSQGSLVAGIGSYDLQVMRPKAGMKRKGTPATSQINRSGSSFLHATATQRHTCALDFFLARAASDLIASHGSGPRHERQGRKESDRDLRVAKQSENAACYQAPS